MPTFFAKREYLKYSLFSLFIPLYSKIEEGKADKQFTRGRIYQYVRDNPGAHYQQIKNELDLKNGTLTYHLEVLMREEGKCEKHGIGSIHYIVSRRDRKLKRFYPGCPKCAEAPREDVVVQDEIVRIIQDKPGLTQTEIAERLKLSRQVVSYNVKQLKEKGRIRLEGEGRETHCYVAEDGGL